MSTRNEMRRAYIHACDVVNSIKDIKQIHGGCAYINQFLELYKDKPFIQKEVRKRFELLLDFMYDKIEML